MYSRLLLVACCIGLTQASFQATLTRLEHNGLRIVVADEPGTTVVAVHYSINKEILGVAAGTYNVDIHTKTDGRWVYENRQLTVSPGDTVYYWLYRVRNGLGEQLLGQSWTAPSQVTVTPLPTQTPKPTAKPVTSFPHTEKPITQRPIATHVSSGSAQKQAVQCTSYPCVIFRDDFDSFDLGTWQHEITAGGGGNWEFEFYTNNRSNSYVRDGVFYIKPTLTADKYGEAFLSSGNLDLWGSCTNNAFYGCQRQGTGAHYINPIQSARVRTIDSFSFRYGRLEVEAKMPTGDWIWPAIWMLPTDNAYGDWPASGEIDLIETRGNTNLRDAQGNSIGVNTMGSTLHFGPYWPADAYTKATVSKRADHGTFGDRFHKFAVEWDDNSIRFFVDDERIKTVDPGTQGFWGLGEFNRAHRDNPWAGRGKMAPFDQKFHIIMNVAVGGTNGYFPDNSQNGGYPKPWRDASETAAREFWQAKNHWYPTWKPTENNGENAAMQVKYIQVTKLKADP